MGLPKSGFSQQVESLHRQYDNPGISSALLAAGGAVPQGDYGFGAGIGDPAGHRSGLATATPWSAAVARPLPSPNSDFGSGGPVTYAATTLTDTAKGWSVGDANSGGTVTYGAATITDTARNNANAWVVGNTAQYAGKVIITATGKMGIIASAAAGVLTLTGNWIGGTPAAGEAYVLNGGGQVGRQIVSVSAGVRTVGTVIYHIGTVLTITAWSNGTPAAGAVYVVGPPAVGPHAEGNRAVVGLAEASDNWYKAQMELGNTEAV